MPCNNIVTERVYMNVLVFTSFMSNTCVVRFPFLIFRFNLSLSARARSIVQRAKSMTASCIIYIQSVPFARCHGFVSPMPTNCATVSSDRALPANVCTLRWCDGAAGGGKINGEIIRIISIVLDVPALHGNRSRSGRPSRHLSVPHHAIV